MRARSVMAAGRWAMLACLLSLSPFLVAVSAYCDDAACPQAVVLSLEECERLAMQQNLATLRAEEGIGVAQAALKQAKATLLPQLNVSGTYTRLGPPVTISFPTATGTEQINVAPSTNKNATFSLSQLVYAVGPMKLSRQAARIGMGLYESTLGSTEDQVKLQVRQAFFNCLRARELLEVAKQRESQVAGHLKDAQSYYEAGTAAKVDVLRAQVEVANAGYQTLAAENGVDLAFIALKNLLNLGQDVSLDLKVPEVPKLVEPDLGRCLETATTKRPDLLGAGFNVELAEAKVALAASETKPTVALAGTKQWTTASTFSSESPWSVSLVATAPLFDGGTGRAKVEGARRERNQAQLDLQALQQAVEAQVRSAFLSLESNRKQMEAAQVAIEQAKEALRITELQYAEGVARAIEVLDAEVALAQASSNRVNAVYDYETAKAQLAQATGVDSLDELANKPVSGSSVQAPGVTAAPGKE